VCDALFTVVDCSPSYKLANVEQIDSNEIAKILFEYPATLALEAGRAISGSADIFNHIALNIDALSNNNIAKMLSTYQPTLSWLVKAAFHDSPVALNVIASKLDELRFVAQLKRQGILSVFINKHYEMVQIKSERGEVSVPCCTPWA
jgi:hypothetical protein